MLAKAQTFVLLASVAMVDASRKPPIFVFDYAKKPVSRWNGALELALRGKSWDDTFGTIFSYHNSTLFESITPQMYKRISGALRKNFPERAEELEGIADQFEQTFPDQVVSFDYLAAWIYYHELGHAEFGTNRNNQHRKLCTGLLAADSSGIVHHAANMDQSPPNVREVTLHVKYIDSNREDGDQLLYQGVDWYWFNTGTTRMVMKGVASVQENWRTEATIPVEDILRDIENGVESHVLVFRNAFERATKDPTMDFETLVDYMATVRLAAPEYIVMAGPNNMQGAVLARNQTGVASPSGKPLRLGENDGNPTSAKSAPEITSWALAQTNYEHWQHDSLHDPRRTAAEKTIANFGQDVAASSLGLYAVASTYPVHATSTAYTAVMSAKTGELQSFVRSMMCPVGDDDCLENAKEHGLGFGVHAGRVSDIHHLRGVAGGSGVLTTLIIIIVILGLALIVMVGFLLRTKSHQRVEYATVPSVKTNGSH